jgi:hypothetical protein
MYFFSRLNVMCHLAIAIHRLRKPKNPEQSATRQPETASLFPNIHVSKVTEHLRKDGFCPDIALSKQNVNSILDFIENIDCVAEHDDHKNPSADIRRSVDGHRNRKCSRSRYHHSFQNCSTIQDIIQDPKLLKIATAYLKTTPIYMGARLWWSHRDAPPYDFKRAGQVFHYDIDDYRALRFFFYLTDVDESSGPHVVIRGSHRHKRIGDKIAKTRFRTDDDLINFYGSEAVIPLCGQAGFGFAEDPSIFHKGTIPVSRDRLILLIRYSINDFGNRN